MRISDWSSDVCSSDLARSLHRVNGRGTPTAAPVATAIPAEVAAEATAVAAGGAAERKIAAEFDAGPEDVVEAETVSGDANVAAIEDAPRSEEHTYELQSLMRISYAVFCLQTKIINMHTDHRHTTLN